jgi:tripartite-type tricarboxylate transporter receptor subunit TctC
MKMHRRGLIFAAAAAAAMLLPGLTAQAQQWPQRSVKFIVPLGPGSGVDITARLVGDRLSKKWGQPVVIENRPGGDSIVAINAFIGAADDHTLLFTPTGAFTAHPFLHDKVPYDIKELVPLARVTSTVVAFAAPASSGVTTVKQLLDKTKANPDKLNWASATATNEYLFAAYMKKAGLSMTKVPYKDSVQPINDLAEGRIDFYVGAYAIIRPHVASGKVKILAITNKERASGAPDLPTAREAGYPDLEFDGLVGIFGPKNLAAAARDQIAADVKVVLTDPEVVQRLTTTGQIISAGTGADFAAAMNAQQTQVNAAAAAIGMKAATN